MREKGFVHYCCYSDSLWIICGLQNWGKDIRAASVFHDLYFLNTQSILIYLVDVKTPFLGILKLTNKSKKEKIKS